MIFERRNSNTIKQTMFGASAALLIFLSGCGAGPEWLRDDPAEVLRYYLQAAARQDTEEAYQFLSVDSQRTLEAQAASFNQNGSGSAPRQGADMLRFGNVLSSTREYRKIIVSSETDSHADVDIVVNEAKIIRVSLARENGRWAVVLPFS